MGEKTPEREGLGLWDPGEPERAKTTAAGVLLLAGPVASGPPKNDATASLSP